MSSHPHRLAVVVSHPIQYYSPWFRWMRAHGWTLRVFYLWDFGVVKKTAREFGRELAWDVDLLSGYDHEFVPNTARVPGTHHVRGLDNPSLNHQIHQWNPDAILLFGYKYFSQLKLIFGTDIPLIFRGDSHLLDESAPRPLKRWLLRYIYARFAAITYVGLANRDYFRAFGVSDKKLFYVPHCVDAARFVISESNRAQADALKRSLGLTGCKVLLFAGKLIPKKQPKELLAAFLSAATPADAALVFVGEGEELAALHKLASTRTDKLVRFLPFANQSEMPSRYLLADIFALPSRGPGETWGLAVNEAMHLGVPCLVSDRVGCQHDLVTDEKTGWVFSVGTSNGLRDAVNRAFTDISHDAEGFRQRVTTRINGYNYANATKGLALAVQHAVAPCARIV